ncbi:MAG TPA: hypothetical protein VIK01_23325 [Polyangiaceae bacterium]
MEYSAHAFVNVTGISAAPCAVTLIFSPPAAPLAQNVTALMLFGRQTWGVGSRGPTGD